MSVEREVYIYIQKGPIRMISQLVEYIVAGYKIGERILEMKS